MTVIGATGHQKIPLGARTVIQRDVRDFLKSVDPPVRLVTSLAAGADQLVAAEALELGASVEAIIPSLNYESTFVETSARAEFDRLLRAAETVTTLEYPSPSDDAFWQAGKSVVDRSDVLVAIWDGRPARGLGGTGDVVRYARERDREVHVIWPNGLQRD